MYTYIFLNISPTFSFVIETHFTISRIFCSFHFAYWNDNFFMWRYIKLEVEYFVAVYVYSPSTFHENVQKYDKREKEKCFQEVFHDTQRMNCFIVTERNVHNFYNNTGMNLLTMVYVVSFELTYVTSFSFFLLSFFMFFYFFQ